MRHSLARSTSITGNLLAFVAAVSFAPAAQAQEQLPSARELVSRHIGAIGGREALASREAIRARGTFEMPAVGLRGDFEMAHARSGEMVMKVSIPGIGDIASGYDGQVAWSMNPMIGPRVLDGEELKLVRDEADFLSALREAPAVTKIETVGKSEMSGEACYRVKVTWASGRTTHDCYSIESGLLLGSESTQVSPTGTLDVTTLVSEYKDFGGMLVPTVTTQRAAGMEQVLRFTSVEFDPIDKETFTLPGEITAIVSQQSK